MVLLICFWQVMGAAFTLIFSGRCKSGHAPFPLSTLCVIMGEEMWVLIFLFSFHDTYGILSFLSTAWLGYDIIVFQDEKISSRQDKYFLYSKVKTALLTP